MAKRTNIDVSPRGDEWAVKRQGAKRASSVHETKAEAVEAGRSLAKREDASLKIRKKDGRIQEERTYGSDPYPPKG